MRCSPLVAPVARRRRLRSTPLTPSLIQTISASGVAREEAPRSERAARLRSGEMRLRPKARSRSRAARRRPPAGSRPGFRRADDGDGAALAARRLDPFDGDGDALAPVVRRPEAVVDEEQDRAGAIFRRRARRIPDRAGDREDERARRGRAATATATRACAPASRAPAAGRRGCAAAGSRSAAAAAA